MKRYNVLLLLSGLLLVTKSLFNEPNVTLVKEAQASIETSSRIPEIYVPAKKYKFKSSKALKYVQYFEKNTQSVIPQLLKENKYERAEYICLALNIYYEVRGSTLKDKIASSYTVFNRMKTRGYDSVCDVIFEPYQYSWTMRKNNLSKLDLKSWKESQLLAYHLLKEDGFQRLSSYFVAEHYLRKELKNNFSWSRSAVHEVLVNEHLYILLPKDRKPEHSLVAVLDESESRMKVLLGSSYKVNL